MAHEDWPDDDGEGDDACVPGDSVDYLRPPTSDRVRQGASCRSSAKPVVSLDASWDQSISLQFNRCKVDDLQQYLQIFEETSQWPEIERQPHLEREETSSSELQHLESFEQTSEAAEVAYPFWDLGATEFSKTVSDDAEEIQVPEFIVPAMLPEVEVAMEETVGEVSQERTETMVWKEMIPEVGDEFDGCPDDKLEDDHEAVRSLQQFLDTAFDDPRLEDMFRAWNRPCGNLPQAMTFSSTGRRTSSCPPVSDKVCFPEPPVMASPRVYHAGHYSHRPKPSSGDRDPRVIPKKLKRHSPKK